MKKEFTQDDLKDYMTFKDFYEQLSEVDTCNRHGIIDIYTLDTDGALQPTNLIVESILEYVDCGGISIVIQDKQNTMEVVK